MNVHKTWKKIFKYPLSRHIRGSLAMAQGTHAVARVRAMCMPSGQHQYTCPEAAKKDRC